MVPSPTQSPFRAVAVFQDEFDGLALETAKWALDIGSGSAILVDGVLQLQSSGRRYPYVHTQVDPFPSEADFQITFRFRYAEVEDCGVGIIMTSYLVPVGLSQDEAAARQQAAEAHGVQAGVWQDRVNGLQLWYRSGPDRIDIPFPGPNTRWNEMAIRRSDGQYTLYLNGRLAYASLETPHRPRAIWIGHPADLGTGCRWDTLQIDYVRIESLPEDQ